MYRPKIDPLFVLLVLAAIGVFAVVMPAGTPTDRSRLDYAPTPTFESLQLVQWFDALRDPVASIPGVWSYGLEMSRNRIEYSVDDEKVVIAIERVLDELEVPREAIHIRIGERPELRRAEPQH